MAHHKRHHDEMNRFWKEEDLLQGPTDTWLVRTYTLDKRGLVTVMNDRRGEDWGRAYDGAGRLVQESDPAGNVVDHELDANGNVTAVVETEALHGTTTTEIYRTETTFDAWNRPTERKQVDRTDSQNTKSRLYKWDTLSFLRRSEEPSGDLTVNQRDGLGRKVEQSVDQGSGAADVTKWVWSVHDQVTQVEDDNGKKTSYAYDDLLRLVTTTYESQETVTVAYDANGNPTRVTDENGSYVDQGFDELDRIEGQSVTKASGVVGDEEVTYAWDALNRLREAQDDDSTVQLTHDSLSRVRTEKQGANPLGTEALTVTNTWDEESNRTRVDYPSGFAAKRTYAEVPCLMGVTDGSDTAIASFEVFGRHHRLAGTTFGNGTETAVGFDGFRRKTEIVHTTSSSSELAGFDYAWSLDDNPLYEARSHQGGKGDVYSYDKANRLVRTLTQVDDPAAEVASPGSEAYADQLAYNYDGVENLSSYVVTPYQGSAATTSFTTNSMNQYTAVGGVTHAYDDNGNLVDDGVFLYRFDAWNHLVEVVDKATSDTVATNAYDALGRGRRIAQTVGQQTTRYVYSDQQVLEERDGSDDLLRLFVFGDALDHVVMMEAADLADYDGDQDTSETVRLYYHTQLVGSVTQLTAPDESVLESYEYGPYGETTVKDASGSTVSASLAGNPFMFTGRRLDEATGLYYYRARYFDPAAGRFTAEDSVGFAAGVNHYVYARNHPVKYRDPSGHWVLQAVGGVVGAGVNYYTNFNAYVRGDITGAEYAGSVLFGAGLGVATTFAPGIAGGALAGGAAAGVNSAFNQYLVFENVDVRSVGRSVALGAAAGGFAGVCAKVGEKLAFLPTSQIGRTAYGAPAAFDYGNVGGIAGLLSGTAATTDPPQ